MSLSSYPSVFNLGHKCITELLTVPVYVQEKIDGSQFSFGVDMDGILHMRSKGAKIFLETVDKLFKDAVDYVVSIKELLVPGYTYRGEVLRCPKHNSLAYDRVPKHNIILFDIMTGIEAYIPYEQIVIEASKLDIEVVPLLYTGILVYIDQLKELLETISILGGQKIEGVVIKPVGYNLFGIDKKPLLGKHVSEAFKEIHQANWKTRNPGATDLISLLTSEYRTPSRWDKAINHLNDAGKLTNTTQDIGPLMKEVSIDVLKECETEIKDKLFKWAWSKLSRSIIAGLPEYYKERLMKQQFIN